MANLKKFNVNSRFPLIGRVGSNSGSITLAAGNYAAQETKTSTINIAIPASAILNISIEADGRRMPSSIYEKTNTTDGWQMGIYCEQTSVTNLRVVMSIFNDAGFSRSHDAWNANIYVDAFDVP